MHHLSARTITPCIGGQPLPGDERLSFANLATGAGIGWSAEARTEDKARARLGDLFEKTGPALLSVRLEEEPGTHVPAGPWSKAEERAMFMQELLALDRTRAPQGATKGGPE